ncbi:MAG: class I SAM-dependent methyltransferase [Deltaproteobacteria bacterium]|nr:class I SAM-dependent methyltransferase [Deltaproteobacteria bacterium]
MGFVNAYQDARRAAAYDQLEFPGTYSLAFRDIPALVREHVQGRNALDFGCGTGRSTRFLAGLGFETIGVDIAAEMVAQARLRDPKGDYRVVASGDLSGLPAESFDLIFSAFTFDNVPAEQKPGLFAGLGRLLAPRGRFVNLVCTPEVYTNEWASFTTKGFPENRNARSGDVVKVITTDHPDPRPVEDILCTDEAYRAIYAEAGLALVTVDRPLAKGDEPVRWDSETAVPPCAVYVLASGRPR